MACASLSSVKVKGPPAAGSDAPAAADALDAAEQLHLPRQSAAALVTHLLDDVAERQIGLRRVHLVHHALLPTPRARDAQEPRREGIERLIERLGGRGQRAGAVAPPIAPGDRADGHRVSP